MEEHRITLYMAEGLAGNQLQFGQALDLELPEQYSTCQVVGGRMVLLLLLQMVAVGVEGLLITPQVALAAAVAAAPDTSEDQAI